MTSIYTDPYSRGKTDKVIKKAKILKKRARILQLLSYPTSSLPPSHGLTGLTRSRHFSRRHSSSPCHRMTRASPLSRLAKEAFSQFDKNNSGNIDQKVNPKSPSSLRTSVITTSLHSVSRSKEHLLKKSCFWCNYVCIAPLSASKGLDS